MSITEFARVPLASSGMSVGNISNVREAMTACNLDWEVEKTMDFVIRHDGDEQTYNGECGDDYMAVLNSFHIRRKDTGDIFGHCTGRYEPLQNVDAFDFFQPFVDEGIASLHTAGSMKDGAHVWIMAEIQDEGILIGGVDLLRKFILIVNTHDAKRSVVVAFTPIRMFCTNMLTSLMHDKDSQVVKIRHSGNVAGAVEEMRENIALAQANFSKVAEKFETLACYMYTGDNLLQYIIDVFNMKIPKGKDELSTKSINKAKEVLEMITGGYGNTEAAVSGTWWAAYNGVTQYLNYAAGRSEESRLNSLWFGSNARTNERALELALDHCNEAT